MQSETKQCQNCKQEFTIEPDDFAFYEKIDVPPPTFCPDCRIQRRMTFFNERALYKRECSLCGQGVISLYSPDTSYNIYCPQCWWSDRWDPMDYGAEYDFSKPFFKQFRELLEKVPLSATQTIHTTFVNSNYCNIASYLKNCYLLFNSDYDEDCAYSTYLERSKQVHDVYMGDETELCFEGVNLRRCNRTLFSIDCQDCLEVQFSKNLRGCSYCFGCINLRNKKYHIFNKPHTKEEYLKEVSKFDTGSYSTVLELRKRVEQLDAYFPKKYMEGVQNKNVSGDYISNSKNTYQSYEVLGVEDSKFCQFLFLAPTRDSYDMTMWGGNAVRVYECMGAGGGENNVKFSVDCWAAAQDLSYCWRIVVQNSNLFGCTALRNKQYCILNKQYSKESFEKLRTRIMKHMEEMPYVDAKGRVYKYGEFFPPEISLYAYNESMAHEYFPLTKEEAEEQGYRWREPDTKNYKITVKPSDLPDHIKDVDNSILQETIGCVHERKCNEQCTTAFKLIPQELQFYKKMNLPLPRFCPNCRHYQRLEQRNPLKLWRRKCTCAGTESENKAYTNTSKSHQSHEPNKHCPNEFETSYAPDRKETVYCEQCYQAEVI